MFDESFEYISKVSLRTPYFCCRFVVGEDDVFVIAQPAALIPLVVLVIATAIVVGSNDSHAGADKRCCTE